ncbi:Dabb family protein [Emticicia sp. 17c]|uniref:Dabb family protein n=1 Tax=Emticicia sp. 17c TaxID=3127704 RepID=UPI00301BD204
MIRHSVVFKLKCAAGSVEEEKFFDAVNHLATIKGVENFTLYKQTSPKSSFDYGLFMDFSDRTAYDNYNSNPLHVAFVEKYWVDNVERFIELDYEPVA